MQEYPDYLRLRIKAEKIKEFNTIYKKKGDNAWVDRRNGMDYLIELKDEEWSLTISIKTS